MYTTLILSIIVTMLFSAFFSGMEIAFVSSNRMLVEMERDRYTLSSRPLQIFFSHTNNFVSTMLVGNNIAYHGWIGKEAKKIVRAALEYCLGKELASEKDNNRRYDGIERD